MTIGGFVAATAGRLRWPIAAMVLIGLCLIVHVRPDIPSQKNVRE